MSKLFQQYFFSNRLVTIPASSYCEKARWALQFSKVPFTEVGHAPILAYMYTLFYKTRSVPIFYASDTRRVYRDSTDIIDYAQRTQYDIYEECSKEWMDIFDTRLGPHARRATYYNLLIACKNDEMAKSIMRTPLSSYFEKSLSTIFFPVMRRMLLQVMNIKELTAQYSWAHINEVCRKVECRLGADEIGTVFLAGDKFGAADLTFASHLAPLLFPPEWPLFYCLPGDIYGQFPTQVQRRLRDLRQRPAGQFVLFCYANYRNKTGAELPPIEIRKEKWFASRKLAQKMAKKQKK